MSPEGTVTENSHCGQKSRGLGLYWSLLSVQTAGAALLLANIVPLYRLMALDFPSFRPDARPVWAIVGILVAQVAYWLRVRLQPPLPRRGHIVLGHIVSFVGKISFVAVTAGFSQMFLTRSEALKAIDYPPVRALAVLIMFFSLFCWTLDLERLAKALQEGRHETNQTHRD